MTSQEAKEILDKFWKSIKDFRPNSIVQSSKELPYTASRIKYAHFVYGEELVKNPSHFIEEETGDDLTSSFSKKIREIEESYGIVDSFFNEEPEPINIMYREHLEGLRNGIITDFRMPNPFGEPTPVLEFHNFIGESWFIEHHSNIFNDSPLGSFIYDGLRNKATEEKDIKLLIGLINTSLTRAVSYPGKKDNSESVFIK